MPAASVAVVPALIAAGFVLIVLLVRISPYLIMILISSFEKWRKKK